MKKFIPACLAAALCAFPQSSLLSQETAAATTQGTVFGTVEVHYQAAKGLLGKMTESTRSRKWLFRVGLVDDGGMAYRVQAKFEVREGGPRPFTVTLPAGSYRFIDAENELSGGLERMSVPLHAHFDVVPGRSVYVGRLLVYVQSKVAFALAAQEVVDCRDVDFALIQAVDETKVPPADAATQLLVVTSDGQEVEPQPFPGCEAPNSR